MHKRLAQLILLPGLVLLAACGQVGQAGTGSTPAATATAAAPNAVNVYLGTIGDVNDDSFVIAVNGTTGQQLWKYNSGHSANATPVLDHGVAYVGGDTSLYALSLQDGKLLWSYATPNNASVLGVQNGLVFGTTTLDNPAIYALDASTGKPRWTYQTQATVEQAILGDSVLYATISKPNCHCSNPPTTLVALSASAGAVKWQTAPYTDYFYIRQIANSLLYGSHAVAEGPSNDLQVRRASNGSVAWQFPKDPTDLGLIAVDGSSVYTIANDLSNFPNPGTNILYALSASTGATRWQTPINKTVSFTGTLINQVIYLGAHDGSSLSAYSATDGKQLWQTALDTSGSPGNQVATVVAIVDGTVYLSTSTRFAALKASDGSLLWRAPVSPFAFLLTVQSGIVYGFSTSKDTSTAGQNSVFALKASDGSSLWSYPVPAVFSTPAVG